MSKQDIYADYIDNAKYSKITESSVDMNPTIDFNLVSNNEQIELLKKIDEKLEKIYSNNNVSDQRNNVLDQNHILCNQVDLAILNGNVVIPDHGVIKTNVLINNGKILSLTQETSINAKEIIDASGKYVLPGIIDPHVHLGLFAPLKIELDTETRSALIGGITTIGCFFGGEESHFKTFPLINENINDISHIDIIPHLVINNDTQRKEVNDYIDHLGITSFKLYMNGIPGLIPSVDDGFILDVFNEVNKSNKKCMICVHTENSSIVARSNRMLKQELGEKATIYDWTNTHPEIAEEEAVIRLSYLAEKTKTQVYMVHISSANAIARLREMKKTNKYVNVETTSPYLSIAKDSIEGYLGKMEPPFRDYKDIEELWKGLDEGIIDTIGTDNVTMTREEKNIDKSLWDAMPGYPAMGTHLPVLINEGVVKRGLPIEKLVTSITKNPAKAFGVYPQKGNILPGCDADVVIFDLDLSKEVKVDYLQSRSDFSLYEEKVLKGWPIATIKDGRVVVRNGELICDDVKGKVIGR